MLIADRRDIGFDKAGGVKYKESKMHFSLGKGSLQFYILPEQNERNLVL